MYAISAQTDTIQLAGGVLIIMAMHPREPRDTTQGLMAHHGELEHFILNISFNHDLPNITNIQNNTIVLHL